MKIQLHSKNNLLRRGLSLGAGASLSLAALLTSFTTTPMSAATVPWDSATSGLWSDGANWTGSNPPVDNTTSDTGQFNQTGSYDISFDANRSVRFVDVRQGTSTFDLGGLKLTAEGFWNGFGATAATTTLTNGTFEGFLYSGWASNGNSLTVDGATITGNKLLVSGLSSGAASGINNVMTLQNGTTANVSSVTVGQAAASTGDAIGNTLTVTGSGTTLTSNSVLWVGRSTTIDNDAQNNTFSLENGATATFAAGATVGKRTAGSNNNISGNRLTVGGTGSILNAGALSGVAVQVENFAATSDNRVTVNTGGTINATAGSTIITNGVSNRLQVSGGTYNAAGQTVLVDRELVVSAGTLIAGTLASTAASGFTQGIAGGFSTGTIEVDTMNMQKAAVFIVGNNDAGTATLKINGTGTHTVGASVFAQSDGRVEAFGTLTTTAGSSNTNLFATGSSLQVGGAATIETLAFDLGNTTGRVDFNNGTTIEMTLGIANVSFLSIAAGSSDMISFLNTGSGDVRFGIGGVTTVDFGNTASGNGFYKVFTNDFNNQSVWGSITIDGVTGEITSGLSAINLGPTLSGGFFVGNANNGAEMGQIFLAVVPEPSTFALLGGTAALLMLRRRRRC